MISELYIVRELSDLLWAESLWLPENTTWDELKSTEHIRYPQQTEFWVTPLFGIAFLAIRILLESFVFLPIGFLGGWVRTPLAARTFQHLTGGFAGRTKFKRVAECAWRFCYYTFAWTLGAYVLLDQPQLSNVLTCWIDWPRHHIPDKIFWYYTIEASYSWSMLYSHLFIDVRRKDFYEMVTHHAVTLLLLWISWSLNMVRVGTLVLFSHDAADIFLELGKLMRYAGWQKALGVVFVVFSIVWAATRFVYYPFWVVRSVLFDAPGLIRADYRWLNFAQRPMVPRILVVLLSALVVLHIVWAGIIVKVAVASVLYNRKISDSREDESGDEDERDEEHPHRE